MNQAIDSMISELPAWVWVLVLVIGVIFTLINQTVAFSGGWLEVLALENRWFAPRCRTGRGR